MKKVICIIAILVILVVGFVIFSNKDASAYLDITCGDENMSKEYKKGDIFECKLAGVNYKIKIVSISDKKIKLNSLDYGLFPEREDGTISLVDKVKKFEVKKGATLILKPQVADASFDLNITWE